HDQQEITIGYHRGAVFQNPNLPLQTVTAKPLVGISGSAPAIGIAMDAIRLERLPLHLALWRGLVLTLQLMAATVRALSHFVIGAFHGQSVLGNITGPVGLVSLVGAAQSLGFVYILSFMALISINLGVINLI